MENPIDKDKITEQPGLLAYPHHIGSSMVKPEDVGKLKSRALSAMQEQTATQLLQIQRQVELLLQQASAIQKRIAVSEHIYSAKVSFEPFVGNVYYLYRKDSEYLLLMIAPDEWGRTGCGELIFEGAVRLLSDHTWELMHDTSK